MRRRGRSVSCWGGGPAPDRLGERDNDQAPSRRCRVTKAGGRVLQDAVTVSMYRHVYTDPYMGAPRGHRGLGLPRARTSAGRVGDGRTSDRSARAPREQVGRRQPSRRSAAIDIDARLRAASADRGWCWGRRPRRAAATTGLHWQRHQAMPGRGRLRAACRRAQSMAWNCSTPGGWPCLTRPRRNWLR